MFWGFVLIYIGINIGNFDIFPDIVGYITVSVALGELRGQHEIYKKGRLPAFIMIFYSAAEVIIRGSSINKAGLLQSHQIGYILLWLFPSIIRMYMVYFICKGFYYVADEKQLGVFRETAKNRWKQFCWLTVPVLFILPFINNSEVWYIPSLILVASYLIATILILNLAYNARNTLSGREG
ncbi:hypothetical protein [Oxobacter pfennigii]|uniref:hypothetical protein n=1 Tax=Oxobacter pfennigii TaxID=36849 RepID=UPI001364B32C|nr:hypothetical protein [Oxobacter pfennigii]